MHMDVEALKPQSRVVPILLNTNRRDDTLACLASLRKNTYRNVAVLVLDNSSRDGSEEAIRSEYPEVQIIRLEQNRGYAGNNNVGIRAALEKGADWVFILNEDTILAPDCLARLVEAGDNDPRIGIVGPMVYHHDEPEVIQSAGGKLGRHWESLHIGQNEPESGRFTVPHEVDWISGCAIMVRRAVIEQAGMIDERYFYYWEETEWCIRAARKGWRVVHVPLAKLWHKGVQRDYHPGPEVTYYNTRNRLLTLSKHQAPPHVRLLVCAQMFRTLASWTLRPKWKEKRKHRNAMWKGMLDFVRKHYGQMPQTASRAGKDTS
jgi:GT2 family glycosyltransferase